ncbi:MAG TPA: thioesterase [Caldithrix abyssi]|uniref:Thioesterase n=1 Tax=Caldithrix abyssi TaxID=187145 RepID=A0A7V4U0V4_CALAY|nr:thioesterase [Caldithrix abyssi]
METVLKRDSWVTIPKPQANARLRLFCLPFAGGNSTAFRNWPDYLPETMEVAAVEIPGHGSRLAEDTIRRLIPLVKAIAEGIDPYLDRPFAFFGHSMGSLLSFELAHYLRLKKGVEPVHLFFSGRGAPHLPAREEPIHGLPQAEFVQHIRNYNGTPKEVLEHQELMDILIPILRADFEVCETYQYFPKPPFNCPITAFGGLQDPSTTKDDLQGWKKHTSGAFNLRMFPGDHFYLLEAQTTLVHTIARDILAHFQLND